MGNDPTDPDSQVVDLPDDPETAEPEEGANDGPKSPGPDSQPGDDE